MPRKKKVQNKKKASLDLTPIHLTCIATLIILLAIMNVIVYLSPSKTVVVHAKDTTPVIQVYYLKGLLNTHPTYREGWVQLAKLQYLLGNNKEAQQAITRVKELDPNYDGLDSLQSLMITK